MRVAVIGATGTSGVAVVRGLRAEGAEVVEVSRANGVDIVSGAGLAAALDGADAVIDASNAFPADAGTTVGESFGAAIRNVVAAAGAGGVRRLVLLSIVGIEEPVFDAAEYYVAKRDQEAVVRAAGLDATVVKTTQWFEFATNPAAVAMGDDAVEVQDWLVQPVAVDAVAQVLVREALTPSGDEVVVLAGPARVRLPELTERFLRASGDARPVRTVESPLPELAQGVLLAPAGATILEPDLEGWLEHMFP